MTKSEAIERAARIWGDHAQVLQGRLPNGGWDVALPGTQAMGATYHCIDGNGHATCHTACAEKEEIRDSFARIRRTRACYRCGASPEHCECPDEYEPEGVR